MATLKWPDGILPSSFNWTLKSNGTSFTSPWNGHTQNAVFPGSAWKASMTLDSLDDYESRYLEVTLFELDGPAGRIKLRDFGRAPAVVRGVPVVNGAAQTGSTLQTKGWTFNVKVLSRGDYITVNNELKMVLADVTSSATGTAAVRFAPMLRNSPANNAAIEVANPYGIFRLEDAENGVSRKPAFDNNFTLNFVEAF